MDGYQPTLARTIMKFILKENIKWFIILISFFIFVLIYYYCTFIVIQHLICQKQNVNQQQNLLLYLKMPKSTEKKIYTMRPAQVSNSHYYNPQKGTSVENTIGQIQQKWLSYIKTIGEYPLNKFKDRGIVTRGTSSIYSRLYASLKVLRRQNSQLPVEIFTFADELNEKQRNVLEQIDYVHVRLMSTSESWFDRNATRYAIKSHAILQSTFEHVLWLDAENIVVHSPNYLFDLPQYTGSSAIFWPDFWFSSKENPIWKILNLTYRAEDYEQESGEMLINKKLSWKALHLAKHLNGDKDVMKLVLEGKDTFHLAWKALNIPFYFIPRYPALAGFHHRPVNDDKTTPRFCGHTMIQHDPFGKILFMHSKLLQYISKSRYSVERKYSKLVNLSNPWQVLVQHDNTATYFQRQMLGTYGYLCMELPKGENEHYPPLLEDDFHSYISSDITTTYLRFLRENDNGVYSKVSSLVV
jgi:hypothetical protein